MINIFRIDWTLLGSQLLILVDFLVKVLLKGLSHLRIRKDLMLLLRDIPVYVRLLPETLPLLYPVHCQFRITYSLLKSLITLLRSLICLFN
jgi:hypothetical protein